MHALIRQSYPILFTWILLAGCRPEMPSTSSVTVVADGWPMPVNKALYGLTIEEINHAVEGGIYAELIQNRSFEDGEPPPNCFYHAGQSALVTPNGWTHPFIPPDAIPGWKLLSRGTFAWLETKRVINETNKRALMVSVTVGAGMGRGGVAAEGYNGISIRKGEKYTLSFFTRTARSVVPKPIRIALENPALTKTWSDEYQVTPTFEWERYHHTFTAIEDADSALLTFTADSSSFFWLDVVSLFPEKTWRNRPNGLRADLMEAIAALNPAFIRFPGGAFAEGYTAGTFPVWHESIGDIADRKHFWNIWSYGTSNGMGFHEYLQMCEDLNVEPIYVVNSGITNQARRPRYEDITKMDIWVQNALDALAYANEPPDSTFGAMRAKNGHPEPFHLKYIEIGSENSGYEYNRRFPLFKKAIRDAYPGVTVISSSPVSRQGRQEWVDSHLHANETFFLSNHNRYKENHPYHSPAVFIGELSTTSEKQHGTLRAAVAEACFLIEAERHPDIVKRLAYAPVLRHAKYKSQRPQSLISFDSKEIVTTPSYHLLQMFAQHRGDELLKTEIKTYARPQVNTGQVAIIPSGESDYEITGVRLNNQPAPDYTQMGDSSAYNYDLSVNVRPIKENGQIRFLLRDNKQSGEEANYICFAIANGQCELYQQTGTIKDTLASPTPFQMENQRLHTIRIICKDAHISCYINGSPIYAVTLPPLPSLVSLATIDKTNNLLLLKVVNTTFHKEKTKLIFKGLSVKNDINVIQLTGTPQSRNTFPPPNQITPAETRGAGGGGGGGGG
ncbi:MAG: glycoside hydrolase, partial [Tannerellaceae bacterium]|nr:glycoside hydrolase [Tannerellaceae bacterium]